MKEPKKPSKALRFLAKQVQEDAQFASLVFDLREVMTEQEATPSEIRAALRLMLHQEEWRKYRNEMHSPTTPNVKEQQNYPFEIDPETGPFFTDDGA